MHSRLFLRGCAVGLTALAYGHLASARALYPSQFYPASNEPAAVIMADMNGDGFPDLVQIGNNGTVAVYSNRGNGSFRSPSDYYLAGNQPGAIAVADLNHDGRPDIVVVNAVDGTVSVLLNQGNGLFAAQDTAEHRAGIGTPAPTYVVGKSPDFVAIGDVNRDGNPDLIVTNYSDNTVSVLLGRRDGTFQTAKTVAVGDGPTAVAIADVNGDGGADLIVANSSDNAFGVLLGNGGGTFKPQTANVVGAVPLTGTLQNLVTGDFNHDGNIDVVITSTNLDVQSVYFFAGRGDGTFRSRQAVAASKQSLYLQAADVDGDGNLDLAVGSFATGTFQVLFGDGDGRFHESTAYPAAGMNEALGLLGLAVGDVNGDGKPDVVTVNPTGGFVQVLLNDGSGGYHLAGSQNVGTSPSDIRSTDLNGDGHMDIVEVNADDDTLGVLLGNGDGTFQALQTYAVGSHPQRLTLADVNGDGKLDAVTANYADNTVSVLLGNGDGTFQAAHSFPAGANPVDVAVADMDQDGKPDIVVGNSIVNFVSILHGQGNGSFRGAVPYPASTQLNAIAVADINHDGYPDVVAVGGTVAVLHNDGRGALQPILFNSDGTSADIYNARGVRVALVDVNHDHNPDILVADYGDSQLAVLQGDNKGHFLQQVFDYPTCSNPDNLAVTDLNGDGNPDVAVSCATSNTVGVMLGNGIGGFLSNTYPAEIDPRGVAIADFNSDGLQDLAIANGGSKNLNVLLQESSAVSGDHAPVAKSATFTIADGRNAENGSFSATDPDGDRLTYVMLQPPLSGTLSYLGSGSFTYTANTGFIGNDSLTFQVSDGAMISNIATLKIVVQNNTAGQSSSHGGLGGFGLSLLPALLALLARRRVR